MKDDQNWIFEDGRIGKGFIQGGSVTCGNCGYVFWQKDPKMCWLCGSEQLIYEYPESVKT